MIKIRKKILAGALSMAMICSNMPLTTYAATGYSGTGSGTKEDPYVIKTVEQLKEVKNNLSASYVLDADIQLTDKWTPIGTISADLESDSTGETPVLSKAFTGTFDGKDHTITGLDIEGSMGANGAGLFGIVANATVKDINISGAKASGNTMSAVGIGYVWHATIDDVDVTNSTINATSSSDSPANMTAAVVGAGMDSTIINCDVSDTKVIAESVTKAENLGENNHDIGVVGGGLEGSTLEKCTVKDSEVIAEGSYCYGIGGLAGCAIEAEYVKDCSVLNTTVTVGDNAYLIGGMVGYTGTAGEEKATEVKGCKIETSIVTGKKADRVGGLIGGGFYFQAYTAIYTIPTRFAISDSTTAGTIAAGEDSTSLGVISGYSTVFDTGVANAESTMTGTNEKTGTVYTPYAQGDGTKDNPYQITDPEGLYCIRYNLGAKYKLEKDIDLSTLGYYEYTGWSPIGTASLEEMGSMNCPNAFIGTLDGNNKSISNVKVDGSLLKGNAKYTPALFGILYQGSSIHDLSVKNVSIKGTDEAMVASAVVAYGMGGTLDNVTLTADKGKENEITGRNCVGGLVGGGSGVNNSTVENTTINIFGDNTKGEDAFSSGRIVQHDIAECGGLIVGGGFGGTIVGNTVKNCTINANEETKAVEAVGLGGIGGCLQCMTLVKDNSVDGLVINAKAGHAIGGITGYTGNGNMADYGYGTVTEIENCDVKGLEINAKDGTHVGGIVGTNMYYNGMEGQFKIADDCSVEGSITAGTDESSIYGSSTAGAVAGHAAGCKVSDVDFSSLTINGQIAKNAVGSVHVMYESADQDDTLEQTSAGEQLNAMFDSYRQLFRNTTFSEKCDNYWHDAVAAVVGESQADATVAMLKKSVGSTKYGAEAEENTFCCDFINGIDNIQFNGTEISGFKDGEEVFSHPYKCIGKKDIGKAEGIDGFGGFAFESLDEESGEFKYFILLPDTMSSTYHIEFRYGSDLDALQKYASGKYANWLAAGISESAMNESNSEKGKDDAILKQVIGLFAVENVSSNTTKETEKQREDIVGIWDADEDCLKVMHGYPGYENAKMYCELMEDGTGNTYVDYIGNGEYVKTSSYKFYTYDNDNDTAKKSGVYLVKNQENETVSSAPYDISAKATETKLYLYAADGISSWTKREDKSQASATPSVSPSASPSVSPSASPVTASLKKGTRKNISGVKYSVTNATKGKSTVKVTGTSKKNATKVIIPSTVKINGITCKVTSIAQNAFKGNNKIKTVQIGENITSIGKKAFYDCKNLKKITIKTKKLTESSIGTDAFKKTSKKMTVKVPASKVKKYKKVLKTKGISKKAQIK